MGEQIFVAVGMYGFDHVSSVKMKGNDRCFRKKQRFFVASNVITSTSVEPRQGNWRIRFHFRHNMYPGWPLSMVGYT
jgi:hypothetical protein